MPSEITMPQLSDTMTEGTVVKWNKKEGEKVKVGEELADVETDKATMPMEAFESGTLAFIAVPEGEKVKVGALLAVIATGKEDPGEIKKQYASRPASVGVASAAVGRGPAAEAAPTMQTTVKSSPQATAKAEKPKTSYNFDIVVIGGGPAGYAAAIRAGQLKKRVLCIEKENLGGTCLNWGCIPTKALLEDGAFVLKMRTEAAAHGVAFSDLRVDFSKIVGRSRTIADKLKNGIGHLFKKYEVKHEMGMGQLLGPHQVRLTNKEGTKDFTAEHIVLAAGARATELPGSPFDGQTIITSREAMTLPKLPKRLAIVGAGAIGCEFADIYSALGSEVTVVEMLPHLLPNEDEDVSIMLERIFNRRGIKVFLKTKTEKVEKISGGVRLTLSGEKPATVEVDILLVAIGVTGNVENLAAPAAKLELFKNRVKVDDKYKTNLENVWAIGDCISMHWPEQMAMGGYRHPDLAHVAHHEAVLIVERIAGHEREDIDYKNIPACTYTHPQVASMGATEKKLREQGREIRIGKFPFAASGRAMASGETDGFVKLIFDAKFGELLGVHMIGENVTELLSELVLARKLEATEEEIIDAIHPHPTLSEAIMEAAGVGVGRAIHL
ncbi:MAG TPA: dihydrolipoyl dehydrogenase [Tepidisphaeraceae bacterium]|nr:dihydrolipoyl dehydrogenase [Tepidisphaeraceae bacterium]